MGRNNMSKYFCGLKTSDGKYNVSIIDERLDLIFNGEEDTDKLVKLLKMKNASVISVDQPLMMYAAQSGLNDAQRQGPVNFGMRRSETLLSSLNFFTYKDRFRISKDTVIGYAQLTKFLQELGFSAGSECKNKKPLIESYPDTSFLSFGCAYKAGDDPAEIVNAKIQTLTGKGIRMNRILRRGRSLSSNQADSVCQAYSAYMYHTGRVRSFGSAAEGYVIVPQNISNPLNGGRKMTSRAASTDEASVPRIQQNGKARDAANKQVCRYCGAQYLYTNTDGVIRINELRPIKSYDAFGEIYDIKYIKLVQVIIATTDGLKRIKANLKPNANNSNVLRAADEESSRRMSDFWNRTGGRKGYLIKFNRVELVK